MRGDMLIYIKQIREKAGLSQEALAAKVGVTKNTIINWENGETYPPANKLYMLADALHCMPTDLILPETDASVA